jgi:hypothetical protein
MPDALRFATRSPTAHDQSRAVQADGSPPGTVLADADNGVDTDDLPYLQAGSIPMIQPEIRPVGDISKRT